MLDVLRTVAHELVHCSQNQQHGQLPDDAGETGSKWENDANARAGIIMRDWANTHPEHFEMPALGEGASGYIPKNKKEAALPQYAMALSVDIKPGEVGRQANKLALHTGRNGEPGLLMKTVNLRESASDYQIHNTKKLDRVLARCCEMIERGKQKDPERYGQVAACVIDPDNNMVYGINLPGTDGRRRHAERVAIDRYHKTHGDIPEGSIVVTTCSPCNSPMTERAGESCKDLINSVGIHKVYCGYIDPTQHDDADADFTVGLTQNDDLWETCKAFADTFLHEGLNEDIENFPIANVRRPNGAIGTQGVNTSQAADVLTHAAGMQVTPDMTMRQLVDALRADPAAQQRLRQFVAQNPVTVYALPDGSYHLQDGHHRTFLLNLLGDETVPAIVKENVTEAKTVEFEGLTLKVIKSGHELTVDALDDWGNKVLGHVKFNIGDGKELDPQDLEVDEKYQGQGIARVMYDYIKSQGYTIVRSWDQTDAGAGFWNKHRGEDVRVWESFLGEANASAVQFQTASTDNYQSSFTVTAIANGKTVGHFSFFRDPKTDDVHNQAEVTDDVQGKGYGKALLLKAIEVANDHGLGFQEDSQSLSRAQSRVYDSLYDAGWIVDADGYWFLTPEGEQELTRLSTMQQGVAENFADGRHPEDKGDAKRHGINTKASVSSLRKTAKQGGRKGQLAHWLANMKAGRAKAKRK
jgi:GNAT superfamily N-acetyltransferase/pyrimidine deaminase RibD-like protein